jgi:hypothetical protein
MKMIAITRTDGGVSVMQLGPESKPDVHVEHWKQTFPGAYVSHREIAEAEYRTADATFRDAWKPDFTIDMEKARAVHMGRIRVMRDKELARLDIETMKGRDVQAEKQRLRDIPQAFDLSAAATPEELKGLWPADLPQPV